MYQYPDYLMHHGVKGMKWGVRKKIATKSLNRKVRKAQKYRNKAYSWETEAKNRDASAKLQGPIAYGKQYNRIKQARTNAKQLQKYAQHYEKKVNSYLDKVQKKYVVIYDVSNGQYSLREKNKK